MFCSRGDDSEIFGESSQSGKRYESSVCLFDSSTSSIGND